MTLQRFLDAQAPVISTVMAELAAGEKRTHWMWFVFPQLAALGRSGTAKFYGLADLDEARAYLAHPVLGERLRACTRGARPPREVRARHLRHAGRPQVPLVRDPVRARGAGRAAVRRSAGSVLRRGSGCGDGRAVGVRVLGFVPRRSDRHRSSGSCIHAGISRWPCSTRQTSMCSARST